MDSKTAYNATSGVVNERGSKSIFEKDKKNCEKENLDFFRLTLFDLRRMCFFVYMHDRTLIEAEAYNEALEDSRREQNVFEEHVREVCENYAD